MKFFTVSSLAGSALASLLFAADLSLASPFQRSLGSATLPLPQKTVAQFNSTKWIENIAVRENGDLLVTIFTPSAQLFSVCDPAGPSPSLNLLHEFTDVDSLLGITEIERDVFVVVGGNFSALAVQINGTASAWRVDLRHHKTPEVTLIAQMTDANFLNGVVTLPGCQNAVLIADSSKGLVWRLNTVTGKYDVAIEVPEMAVAPGSPLEIGVNGIRLRDGYLYWTNTFVATIYRVKVDRNGYIAAGAQVETVGKVDALGLDDFGLDEAGNIWVATDLDNRLVVVNPSTGESIVVEGAVDQLTLAGDTAAQFGRGRIDRKTLYVTTSGGLGSPVNGTLTEGGKVVAIDTRGFRFQ